MARAEQVGTAPEDLATRDLHDLFISYRSMPSAPTARRLASALYALGKRHRPQNPISIFLDRTSLKAGVLEERIRGPLLRSRNLVVVLDPTTRDSLWVNEEIETWLGGGGSSGRLFLVRSSPEVDLTWQGQGFARPEALPAALTTAFTREQKWFDVPPKGRFDDSTLAGLYAAVMDIEPKQLELDEQHYQRLRRRRNAILRAVGIVLIILVLVAGSIASVQWANAQAELRQRTIASLSNQAVNLSTDNPRAAALSALAALDLGGGPPAYEAVGAVIERNYTTVKSAPVTTGAIRLMAFATYLALSNGGNEVTFLDSNSLATAHRVRTVAPVQALSRWRDDQGDGLLIQTSGGFERIRIRAGVPESPITVNIAPITPDEVLWFEQQGTGSMVIVTKSGAIATLDSQGQIALRGAVAPQLSGITSFTPDTVAATVASDGQQTLYLTGSALPGYRPLVVEYRLRVDSTPSVARVVSPMVGGFSASAVVSAIAPNTRNGVDLIVGTTRGAARYDLQKGEVIEYPVASMGSPINFVKSNGSFVLLGTRQGTRAIPIAQGDSATPELGQPATAISVEPELMNGRVYLGHSDGRVTLVSPRSNIQMSLQNLPSPAGVGHFAADGAYLRSSFQPGHPSREISGARLRGVPPHVTAGEWLGPYNLVESGSQETRITSIASNDRLIAAMSREPTTAVTVWDRGSRQLVQRVDLSSEGFNDPRIHPEVTVAPDGSRLAAYAKGHDRLCTLEQRASTKLKCYRIESALLSLGYSSDSVLRGIRQRTDGSFSAIEIREGDYPEIALEGQVSAARWSPDGQKIAVARGSDIAVHDAAGKRIAARTVPYYVDQLWWSPSSSQIAMRSDTFRLSFLSGTDLTTSAPSLHADVGETIGWRDESVPGGELGAQNVVALGMGLVVQSSEAWRVSLCRIAGTGFSKQEWEQYVGKDYPFVSLCPNETSTSTSTETGSRPAAGKECPPSQEQIDRSVGGQKWRIEEGTCSGDALWYRASAQQLEAPNRGVLIFFRWRNEKWEFVGGGSHGGTFCAPYRTQPDFPLEWRDEFKNVCDG